MITFEDYYIAGDLQEAIRLLAEYGNKAAVLAGGTDLLINLNRGLIAPQVLVDISGLKEIQEIKVEQGVLVIGAGLTFARLARDPLVITAAPLIAKAAIQVGSPQIRNRGTLGGNLGTASPAGDLLTPLVALESVVCLVDLNGTRTVPVESFLSVSDQRIKPFELIREIRVPLYPDSRVKAAYVKLGRRKAMAVSRLNVGLCLDLDQDEKIKRARLAVGSAGKAPFRVPEAEKLITEGGKVRNFVPDVMDLVSKAVAISLGNRPSAPYKVRAVRGVVLEALERCGMT